MKKREVSSWMRVHKAQPTLPKAPGASGRPRLKQRPQAGECRGAGLERENRGSS